MTAATSGTLNSARLAARLLPIPVRLVDSGTAGFGVSCCVWAAGEAIANGATIDQAVQAAESLTPHIGAVFVVGQLDFIRTGDGLVGVPVMTVHDGRVDVVSRVSNVDEAVDAMADTAYRLGASRLNVAIGMGDRSGAALTEALANAVTRISHTWSSWCAIASGRASASTPGWARSAASCFPLRNRLAEGRTAQSSSQLKKL